MGDETNLGHQTRLTRHHIYQCSYLNIGVYEVILISKGLTYDCMVVLYLGATQRLFQNLQSLPPEPISNRFD